jgi:hypothetical protein
MKYFCTGCGEAPYEEDVKRVDDKLIHDVDYCGKEVTDLEGEPDPDRHQKAIDKAAQDLIRKNGKE